MNGRSWALRGAIVAGLLLSTLSGLKAEENAGTGPLFPRLNWVQFQVVRGRIAMCSARVNGSRNHSADDPATGSRESLSLTTGPSAAELRYERVDERQHLTLVMDCGNELHIRQVSPGNPAGPQVEFHQPAAGRIVLSVAGGAGVSKRMEADTLWQLLLAHPDECQKHLLPILERLRPDWHLLEQSRQIEEALFRLAHAQWLPDRSQWQHWVDELASADFRVRRAADRQLRQVGQALLPYLESLDTTSLDAEQRLRIRMIRDSLAVNTGDEAQRVAVWLSTEPAVWLSLLDHAEPSRRAEAARRLALLSGRSIEFDPDATPEDRSRQIRQLSGGLAGNSSHH